MLRPKLLILLLAVVRVGASQGNDRVLFLVFPFENQTNAPSLAWIGEAIAISISDSIIMQGVDSVSRDERLRFVEGVDLPPGAALSQASKIRVAQAARANKLILGSYSDSASNLRIRLRVLDMESMRLGGEIVASGTVTALRQLENELAWIVLSHTELGRMSREKFKERTRLISNSAFIEYIRALGITDEDDQVTALQRIVSAHPRFAQAQFDLAKHYFESGDCAKVIDHLGQSETWRQNQLDAQFLFATCSLSLGRMNEAARAYSLVLARYQPVEVLNNMAVVRMRQGKIDEAILHLQKARMLNPGDPSLAINQSIAHLLVKDYSAGVVVLEETLRLSPGRGMMQFMMGVLLEALGDEESASTWFARARRLGGDVEALKRENPSTWMRVFPAWNARFPRP